MGLLLDTETKKFVVLSDILGACQEPGRGGWGGGTAARKSVALCSILDACLEPGEEGIGMVPLELMVLSNILGACQELWGVCVCVCLCAAGSGCHLHVYALHPTGPGASSYAGMLVKSWPHSYK